MGTLLLHLAAPTPQEVQRKAEGYFALFKEYATNYWYITIPATFVGVFLVCILWFRWKTR